jgi:hypothetical protein
VPSLACSDPRPDLKPQSAAIASPQKQLSSHSNRLLIQHSSFHVFLNQTIFLFLRCIMSATLLKALSPSFHRA